MYWFAPKYWVWNLKQWFARHITPHAGEGSTQFKLLSYFIRYSTEQKKNTFLGIQKENGSRTKEQKEHVQR